jgi:hypothetical protein
VHSATTEDSPAFLVRLSPATAAVVFVHPTSSRDPAARTLGLPDSLIDFTADTTRAVAQLHFGNTFARTPNVKYPQSTVDLFGDAGLPRPVYCAAPAD